MAKASDSADGSTTAEVAPGGASAAPRRPGRARAASAPSRRRWPFLVVLLLAWAVGFANAATWSLITPIGASPDEPAHIIKAAGVARGQLFGEDVDGTQTRTFVVPAAFDDAAIVAQCNLKKVDISADCGEFPERDGEAQLVTTRSTAGLYNPVYYAMIGWPSVLSPNADGIVQMRLVSAAIVSLFAALAIAMLALLPRSRFAVATTAIAFTPMLWFLGGSVNPNALEVTGTAAFLASLLVVLRVRPRGSLGWAALATVVVSGALVPHVRTTGFVWTGVALVAAVLLVGWKQALRRILRWRVLTAAVLVVAAIGGALLITMRTGTLGQNGTYPGVGTSFTKGFRIMLEQTFFYLEQAVGLFAWGDTHAPEFTFAIYGGGILLIVALALLLRPRSKEALATWFALLVLVLLPPIMQGISVKTSGFIWQGRYNLALIAILMIVAGLAAGKGLARLLEPRLARRARLALIGLAAAGAIAAEVLAYRRQSVGLYGETMEMLFAPRWTTAGLPGWAVIAIIAAACLLYAVVLALIAERGARGRRIVHETRDAVEARSEVPGGR